MRLRTDVSRRLAKQFVAVIVDNEVTVGELVTDPPLRWLRLVLPLALSRSPTGIPTHDVQFV